LSRIDSYMYIYMYIYIHVYIYVYIYTTVGARFVVLVRTLRHPDFMECEVLIIQYIHNLVHEYELKF